MSKRGRKAQPATPGTRVSLGLKVTADIKNRIDAAAKASGRTQSQEAERLIEFGIVFAMIMQAARKTEDIERAPLELAQKRFCHTSADGVIVKDEP